jgi:hypothetical protein
MTIPVFLSASVPLPPPHRDEKYFNTADIIAIRDSIKALVTAVAPVGKIVFGGHPAITPMIRLMIREMKLPSRDRFVLFLSRAYEKRFIEDNQAFEDVVLVDSVRRGTDVDQDASLMAMRNAMIASEDFAAAFFIGGMEGVELEYDMFRTVHPRKPAYPIATTGAAAKLLFEAHAKDFPELAMELTYLSLFRRLLKIEPNTK